MAEASFRPEPYGYGAEPANWRGWAASLCFSVPTVVLTGGFVWLCLVKCSGPRRWGGRE